MIISADNLVARLEKIRPELIKQLRKAPNRLRCNPTTYVQLCRDAQAYFNQPELCHVKSLWGATVLAVTEPVIPDGVVLFDHHEELPRA